MKTLFIAVMALFMSVTIQAQDNEYKALVETCLTSNGTVVYYEDVVDQLFDLLKEKYVNEKVPNSVWDELKQVKPSAIENVKAMIAQAYFLVYTKDDVKNMNTFYTTKAGRKYLKRESLSKKEDKLKVDFFTGPTGRKIVENQEIINASMKNVSQNWSGNLYFQLVGALSDKGYNL